MRIDFSLTPLPSKYHHIHTYPYSHQILLVPGHRSFSAGHCQFVIGGNVCHVGSGVEGADIRFQFTLLVFILFRPKSSRAVTSL